MDRIDIKEFKDKSNFEIIEAIMNGNNGYVTTKLITELGIHRMYLNLMVKKGMIQKVGTGIYIDSNKVIDYLYVFNLDMPNTIYSHMTALYLHGLIKKKQKDKYDITVKNNYNSPHLKNNNVFYVSDDVYELGVTSLMTPDGNEVKAYNIERCICDVIRSKNRLDRNDVKHVLQEYFKRKDKDFDRFLDYAEKLNINEEVIGLIKLLYE